MMYFHGFFQRPADGLIGFLSGKSGEAAYNLKDVKK